MSRTRTRNIGRGRSRERGYSMIELSVALLISLFLLNGMFMILQGTRKTAGNQNMLAQLQDEERVAMTMITDVIQQAGYYPNAQTVDSSVALPVLGNFATAGQAVFGVANANPLYGDTVTVRYNGDSTNTVLDCRGVPLGDTTLEEMTFFVQPSPTNASVLELFCTVNDHVNPIATVPLVQNVTSLAVSYGVDANSSGSANTYLTADQMVPAAPALPYWSSVYSVKLTVNFANPLAQAGEPGQSTVQTISFNRSIGIMARTGVNVLTSF